MYTQKDIEEFAYLVTMTLLDKIVKPLGTEVCLKDNFISYDNPLLKDFCLSTGWVDDEYWTIERWYREDSLLEGFTERVSAIYPIKNLYLIGLNLDFISNLINRFHEDGYVFDITSSIEVKQVITPQQLQYIESLEWDCDYWDSLPIEVIDSLDPEVRELCFEYYNSMLLEQALDPVEDTELESMFEFGIDAVMSYEQLDMLGVETLTSHQLHEMLNTVESITVKVEPVRDDVKLLPPVEVITPQEVVSEPQEDCLSTTTLNEDTMNNNTFVESVSNDAELIKFSEFYALCVYYHTMKHLHNIDVWANGDAHKVYASQYSKALLSHYDYDDEYLVDISFEKDFSNVVEKLVHDPYDLWVIAHMTSKLVNDYRDELHECLWYVPYKAELIENFNKYVPAPSSNSQYIIACDVEVVEPTLVHHDVKLDDVELPVIVPQEVVSEPQEELSTTTNEDLNMNTSTVWLDWSISPCLKAWELDLSTAKVVEPVVELTSQCSELTCHISDGWFGQCCNIDDAPKPVQLEPEQLSDAQYRVQQACAKMARRSAYASPVRCGSPVVNTPTITTKSGDIVKVSDEEFAELESMFDKAMAKPKFPFTVVNNNSLQGNQINPDCSRAKAIIGYGQVSEFKSTLFNVDEYDITRNVVVDVATTTPATPKATPKVPKPSTAKFANNFNSLVIAKYRELNNGIIKDSLVLNKLTSALRANNVEAYTNLVTTFNNPTAVALHRQAYDAVVSAS